MDRERGPATGMLCRLVRRTAVGLYSTSIRFEGYGGGRGLNRTGKSCRLRWVNYLHPGLKRGRMTPQEERLVLELHSTWGNRWSRIARRLPGRTDNEIKNYWRTHMRKKAQERKRNLSMSCQHEHEHEQEQEQEQETSSQEIMAESSGGESSTLRTGFEELEEEVKGYSLDQFWNEISCKDGACDVYYPPPVHSPVLDYGYSSDALWKFDDEHWLVPQYHHSK
ncbi:hypothetical protein J5N97_014963 [Dioscorea zingiberensis]|uniref:Uncharacterized protein n=1 Tax=Dioscorea zingiberensis TaxID=325984 RepID=A0A9D5HK48_9LILI|nr:hypothetical protein J5N97_014963 [Dioscorea zingiberensis]